MGLLLAIACVLKVHEIIFVCSSNRDGSLSEQAGDSVCVHIGVCVEGAVG